MASKRKQRRKSCDGKKRFAEFIAARRAATSHQYAFGQWMTPYHCKFCNGWHIGHPPKNVRRAIIASMAAK